MDARWNAEFDDEAGGGSLSAKGQVGVVFVDEHGKPVGLPYSSLLSVVPRGDDLVAAFTTHAVTLSGYGLVAPIHTSLLMYLTLHKMHLVQALVGGRDRDFGPEKGKPLVTSIRWEEVKPQD